MMKSIMKFMPLMGLPALLISGYAQASNTEQFTIAVENDKIIVSSSISPANFTNAGTLSGYCGQHFCETLYIEPQTEPEPKPPAMPEMFFALLSSNGCRADVVMNGEVDRSTGAFTMTSVPAIATFKGQDCIPQTAGISQYGTPASGYMITVQ